jgi:GT2 family glycosyltransferase
VVPTYGRSTLLPRLIGALSAQRQVETFEVIVVDDASPDDTWSCIGRLCADAVIAVRAFRMAANGGPAVARNVGWRAARAPLVAFTDDDCVPDEQWLASLLAQLEHADIVQGQTRPDPDQVGRHGPFSRTIENRDGSAFFETCNVAYRRAVLEKTGGFDERFRYPAGEDTELAWRAQEAGARSSFAPEALVLHDVRPSSFLTHIRTTWRWSGVVLIVKLRPELRRLLHSRYFWKASHKPAIVATAGLVVALRPRSSPAVRALGFGATVPYIRFRRGNGRLRGGRFDRNAAIPFALVADMAEVATMAAASVRFRTFLL